MTNAPIVTRQRVRALVLDGLALAGVAGIVGGAWALDVRAAVIAVGALCLTLAIGLAARRPGPGPQ